MAGNISTECLLGLRAPNLNTSSEKLEEGDSLVMTTQVKLPEVSVTESDVGGVTRSVS